MDIQHLKQRFGIIGNNAALNRALNVAHQVAPTDISVLITGESGTGKEIMPKIIHQLSARKHGASIAVNCGAIPEGTIDSELFGHEKGSFTGAHDQRKGYFEVANGGTIFLDEVAELPLPTQVRLLRVLETGEFIRVGSSKIIRTDVRVVAATNENMQEAIQSGKFREDLFYRLSTIPISLPPLRERKEDIHLLFRKFSVDFSEKYRMPPVKLTAEAVEMLTGYNWPGNIRQLKNTTEQISVIESERNITPEILQGYLPNYTAAHLPILARKEKTDFSERDLLYKVLFDVKRELTEVKKIVIDLLKGGGSAIPPEDKAATVQKLYREVTSDLKDQHLIDTTYAFQKDTPHVGSPEGNYSNEFHEHVEVEDTLTAEEREKELIRRALEKHKKKRKHAARDLGISERTLYRRIKEYNLK